MFRPAVYALLTSALLAGCGGNPFKEPGTNPVPPPGGTVSGVTGLPGTATPTAGGPITRTEARAGNGKGHYGDGFVSSVSYNAVADTFRVDGLAFDGPNEYRRAGQVDLGDKIKAFASDPLVFDPVTGKPIPQLTHRAIYGENASGTMNFAIVRTGSYVNYGFGGFIYNRGNNPYSMPAPNAEGNRGMARFDGDYASLRDFSGTDAPVGGLEYGTGEMMMTIDFDDFNDGNGIYAEVTNRRIFDINGNDITSQIIASLPDGATALPTLRFDIGPGVLDPSGEMSGGVSADGVAAGTYYAVLGGQGATDVVGIITLDPVADGRFSGTNVRETGGFILTRE